MGKWQGDQRKLKVLTIDLYAVFPSGVGRQPGLSIFEPLTKGRDSFIS